MSPETLMTSTLRIYTDMSCTSKRVGCYAAGLGVVIWQTKRCVTYRIWYSSLWKQSLQTKNLQRDKKKNHGSLVKIKLRKWNIFHRSAIKILVKMRNFIWLNKDTNTCTSGYNCLLNGALHFPTELPSPPAMVMKPAINQPTLTWYSLHRGLTPTSPTNPSPDVNL